MFWEDRGICLHTKPLGESKMIVSFFTEQHGVHLGVMRRLKTQNPQPGNEYGLHWSARLSEHLGEWRIEGCQDYISKLFRDAQRLLGVSSACALMKTFLPERQVHTSLFDIFQKFMNQAHGPEWLDHYIALERALLQDCGYVLNWEECAVTKVTESFHYISPQTGNAVTKVGAQGYEHLLLPYPQDPFEILKTHEQLFLRLHAKNDSTPALPVARGVFVCRFAETE